MKTMICRLFLYSFSEIGKYLIFPLLICCFSFTAFSQNENKHIRKGNNLYDDGKYTESQASYLKALEENSKSFSGAFNLADALYKQENYEEAASQFDVLSKSTPNKILKAKALHNQGNSLLKANKFEESITAYKNALKNNPRDNDTRYNLAYAQQMLKQQQQQEKEDEEKKDKNEENKDKDKDKEEKKEEEKKDQQQKEKEEEEQKEQQEEQPKKDQLSKEEAQRLLDALNNEEKKVQDKLNKKKAGVKVQIEKDW